MFKENIEGMLLEMSKAFEKKLPEDYEISVNLKVDEFVWHVVAKDGELKYGAGEMEDAEWTLSMSSDTLRKTYEAEWSGLTAAGRAHIQESAPINFTLPKDKPPLEAMQMGYFFMTHFFSPEYPTRIKFGPDHTRKIHGGNAAALFYHPGLRSSYYCVKPGEVLNEDGAKDPMHQSFIVIGGKGVAEIDEKELRVSSGDAVYVPPNTVHKLSPSEDEMIELIWLAWGEGA